ncbi:MAG: ATP-grasp domain-containing protein [Planctomycetaceae bacterium]
MTTLFLTPRFTEDSQALWRAANQRGWSVERLSKWEIPDHLRDSKSPVLYVEALMGPTLAAQCGIRLLSPPEDWLIRLPQEYKHREIWMTTLGEARKLAEASFVKPPNDKSFPADVYLGSELPLEFDDDMSVLVSEVVQWKTEFRCFIANRKLKTYSIYLRDGELQRESGFVSAPQEDRELKAFVESLLQDPRVDLPQATVVDVGVIEGHGWACIEQNAAWGAGIYGCDPGEVLDVIELASVK